MPVFVKGVGMLPVKDYWDKSVVDLATDAALLALDDANLKPKEIDMLLVSNMTCEFDNMQLNLATAILDALGIKNKPVARIESACSSGGVAIFTGFRMVKGGMRNVLVVGVEKLMDILTPENTAAMMLAEDYYWTFISGATFPSLNALALRYYMHRYNIPHEDIMMFPVIEHDHGYLNPLAQFRRKITLEMVKNSPMVADPIHILESSSLGDGAAALVLTSDETDVEISGAGLAIDYFKLYDREDPLVLLGVVKAAKKAYEMAHLTPKDIQIAEVHDAFSITGILGIEALGLAGKGEGAKLAKNEELRLNGRLPTNTFGGLKARGHPVGATGIYEVAEVALQLRGDAGNNQVDGVKIGIAENIGAVGSSATVFILTKKT